VKWIYLARRAAGVTRDEFPKAWRSHARLASRFPDLAGYFQATVYCLLSGDADDRFDAAGILTLQDDAAIRAVLDHPDAVATMHPDELRVFEDLVARLSLAADETVVVEGAAGPHARLILLESRAVQAQAIDAAVREVVEGLAVRPNRCVVDHVREGVFNSIHPWSAIIELHGEPEVCERAGAALAAAVSRAGALTQVEGPVTVNWRAEAQA
jgi:hypothetical protein